MFAEQVNQLTQEWRFIGFVDATEDRVGETVGGSTIVGSDDWLMSRKEPTDVVLAIGAPRIRAEVVHRIRTCSQLRFPNLVHPSVSLEATRVELGDGNVLAAGVSLTCDIELGDFNYLNPHATVGHDVRLGSFNVVNPGAHLSGGVVIQDEVLVGTGAQLLQGVTVGHSAVVGAGAVVLKDVADGVTVVGVPARPLRPAQSSG
jgi:sugar O-acyltransferase (sialic acid O-acetyltransferase NeuD family)